MALSIDKSEFHKGDCFRHRLLSERILLAELDLRPSSSDGSLVLDAESPRASSRNQVNNIKLTEANIGDVFPGAERETSLSIGPNRNGVFVAKPWRIWSQGDEFYAAQRDGVSLAKVSFHSSRWHLDCDDKRIELGAPLALSLPGWSLALQIKFLVRDIPMPSALLKKIKPSGNVIGVETPPGSKLLVNILCAPRGTELTSPIPQAMDGVRFVALPLRTEGTVVVTAKLAPLDSHDVATIARVSALRLHATVSDVHNHRPNVESIEAHFKNTGNVIVVVPLAEDSLHLTLSE